MYIYMSHVVRKPVCDQVRLKPACSATESSYGLKMLDITSRGIILSRQWTIKVLIRLRRCTGWSAPLLFAYGINRFCHDIAHIFLLNRSQFKMWIVIQICPIPWAIITWQYHIKCTEVIPFRLPHGHQSLFALWKRGTWYWHVKKWETI